MYNVGIDVNDANEINKLFKAEGMLSPKEKELKSKEEAQKTDFDAVVYSEGDEPLANE